MKKFLLLLVLLLANKTIAQNFQDTKGELQISNSGSSVYNLPIAMPPSIKNVAPVIILPTPAVFEEVLQDKVGISIAFRPLVVWRQEGILMVL